MTGFIGNSLQLYLIITAHTLKFFWTPSALRMLYEESALSLSLKIRPTVSRPVCLGIKHKSVAYVQVFIAVRQLWVCWPGALSLTRGLLLVLTSTIILGKSPVELATIFYSLRFETSVFVASYDSQSYGGSMRSRLHTGLLHWKHERTPFYNFQRTEQISPPPSVPLLLFVNALSRKPCINSQAPVSFLSVYNFQFPYSLKPCPVSTETVSRNQLISENQSVATCLPIRFLETAHMSKHDQCDWVSFHHETSKWIS
jgi:hypothetical protein